MSKASAPQAPDYSAAAKDTAAGNLEMAKYATNANRINQVTPYGSLTYSKTQPTFDQAGYDKALAAYNAGGQQAASPQKGAYNLGLGEFGGYEQQDNAQATQKSSAPRREDFMGPDDGGGWTQTMNLTPQAQATLDKQMALSDQYADTASKGFANVQGLLENPNIDLSGIPEMRGIDMSQVSGIRQLNPNMSNIRELNSDMSGIRGLNTSGMQNVRGIDANQLGDVRGLNTDGMQNVQGINLGQLGNVRGLNTSNLNDIRQLDEAGLQSVRQLTNQGLPQSPINAGQTAQEAILSRLNPTLANDEEALRTRLSNQGISLGSAAYNREMQLAGQRGTDLRLQAAAQGIGLDQAARQQAFGENQALSNFDMALQGQQFGQRQAMTNADAARRSQMFGENQAMSNFDAARRAQGLTEQQTANQADLALNNQQFGQRQAMSNFDAARRAQGLSEQQAANQSDMALNNQQFGQRQAMTAADLAQNQQQFGQNQALTNSDLARNQQAFGQNQAASLFDLSQNNQQFNQQQNLAALSGQQRNQALQEAYTKQSRPLDLINSLRTGAQVQNPQFQNFAQQQTTQGANLLGAAQSQYNADMQAANAQNAGINGLLGGVAGIGLGLAGLPGAGGSISKGFSGLFS